MLAVRADGSSFGALADTTYRTEIDLRNGIEFTANAPFPVLIIEGRTPQAVLTKLGELTGTIELPPLWALGYQQARWSYYPDTRVKEIADELARFKALSDKRAAALTAAQKAAADATAAITKYNTDAANATKAITTANAEVAAATPATTGSIGTPARS